MTYAYTMRSWDRRNCGDLATWEKYVRLHRDLGYNNISFDIAWSDVEVRAGEYDFSGYDQHLKAIVDEGMSLQIKMNTRAMPAWIRANRDALLYGPDGRVVEDNREQPVPYHNFADPYLIEAMQGFYRKVAEHSRGLPNLFFVGAFACSFESEYHGGIWTDYSPAAQRQFREYLRSAYRSLAELNASWLTVFATWDEVGITWQPPEKMRGERPDPRFVDFMKYREWAGRRFFDAMHEAIKAGDGKAEYGPQVGRIVCEVGPLRGTVGAFYWAANCEWMFVDPAPIDDMPWEMAVARAGGKKVAVELDGPYSYRNHKLDERLTVLYAEQSAACYEHGADYVCHANWTETRDYARVVNEGLFRRFADAQRVAPRRARAADAVFVGKWDSYLRKDLGWAAQPDQVRETAMGCFQALRKQGKSVDVVMDDTILQSPASLKPYERIHLCATRFVDRNVWMLLRASGAELVFVGGTGKVRDEAGAEIR
ncbi:MAG: beta-galactosidase [Planctomycetota bacterium]|nr:beta-galactosidase [Planctomycetota bacterium]